VTPLPPAAAEAKKAEAQAAKEAAARTAAEKWLAVLDSGNYGKAWDQTAKAFRKNVTRQQWVESLPKTRGALGAAKSRAVEVSSYKASLAGMPEGDYVTVRFSTSFEKKSDAQEIVTLVYEDGAWRPLGYGV
jgi:aspartate aminotransferase-like enzyme